MTIKNSAGRRNMTVQKRKTFVLCVVSVLVLILLCVACGISDDLLLRILYRTCDRTS